MAGSSGEQCARGGPRSPDSSGRQDGARVREKLGRALENGQMNQRRSATGRSSHSFRPSASFLAGARLVRAMTHEILMHERRAGRWKREPSRAARMHYA